MEDSEDTYEECFHTQMGFADPKLGVRPMKHATQTLNFQCRERPTGSDDSMTLWRVLTVHRNLSFILHDGHFYLHPTLCPM